MIKNNLQNSKKHFRLDIQGLRGVAILAVLAFHYRFFDVDGGFLGVDIFFVISGFLITTILSRSLGDQFASNLFAYYAKRFWRIAPAYIVVVLLTLAMGWLLLLPQDLERLGRSSLYSSFFASNFFYLNEAGYFDLSGIYKPLLHTWSLAVEIQFYLIWPFVLYGLSSLKSLSLLRALTVFFIIMLVGSTVLSVGDRQLAFFMMYSRLWEFAIGGLVALKLAGMKQIHPAKYANLWGFLALVTLLASFFFINNDMLLPAPGALVPVLATAALIYLGAHSKWTYQLLSARPLVWIGEISYSLYLVHWPLMVYLSYVLYPEPSAMLRALVLLASLPLAFLLYRFVEVPFRDRGKKQPFSMALAGAALLATGLVVGLGLFVIRSHGAPDRFSAQTRAAISQAQISDHEDIEGLSNNLENSQSSKLVLWGDSHAFHFRNAVKDQAHRTNLGFAGHYLAGCPPIDGVFLKRHFLSPAKGCRSKNSVILSSILADDKIKIVVLASRWAFYAQTRRFAGEAGSRAYLSLARWSLLSVQQSQVHFRRGLAATIDKLVSSGKRVVLLGQVPEFGFDPPRCIKMSLIAGKSYENCNIGIEKMRHRQKYAEQTMVDIAASRSTVSYFRSSKVFCDDRHCSPLVDGKIAYSDDDHLNAFGAQKAVQGLKQLLVKTPSEL